VDALEVARWDGSQWSSVGTGLYNLASSPVRSYNGNLYNFGTQLVDGGWRVVGSSFVGISDTVYQGLAVGDNSDTVRLWDGTNLSAPLGASFNGSRTAYLTLGNNLIAAGYFTSVGGTLVNNIAQWDGTTWAPLGVGLDSRTECLAEFQGKLVAGGYFGTAGGHPANHVAAWDGQDWSPLTFGTDAAVSALAAYGGTLFVGGAFTTAGGVPASGIATWNGSAWGVPNGLAPNSRVESLIVYNGELVACGTLTLSGSSSTIRMAAWNGLSWRACQMGRVTSPHYMSIHGRDLIVSGAGWARWRGSSPDFDGDGAPATDLDIEAFFACIAGNCCPTCGSPDYDGDGSVATDNDIEAFLRSLSGMGC
jgi:hypothetical protein